MKTEYQLKKSVNASCKQAIKLAESIAYSMTEIRTFGGDPKILMPRIRKELAELNQRVHEFNAYNNSLTT